MAGKKISEGRQTEDMQDEQIADLQDQVDSQPAPAYAPPPPAYATPPPAPAQPPAAAAPGAGSDTVARFQELANLHASGVLTDDEIAAAKQKVLAGE